MSRIVQEGRSLSGAADVLIGASICVKDFHNVQTSEEGISRQMLAAASQLPDFFAVEGIADVAQLKVLLDVLERNAPRTVPSSQSDTRGFPVEADAPAGFAIPAVIFCESPP